MANLLDEATYKEEVKGVWKVTLWLGILTILEVGFALLYIYNVGGFQDFFPRVALNVTFIVATIWKAFYIVAEFMHLKHEHRAFIISLGIPMIFLVWALIAFMHEADAWYHMKGF